MRQHQVRTAALSRHSAPDFLMCHGLELLQLRKLNDFAFRLFIELLAMCDFATGQVRTSHAVLISLMDFDRAPQAHATLRPTKRRIQGALQMLLELRLIFDLDSFRNEQQGGLFFRVLERGRIGRSDGMSVPMSVPPKKRAKQAPARPAANRTNDEGTDERTGVQERKLSPKSPLLSTGEGAANHRPQAARDALQRTRANLVARRGNPLK